MSMFLIEDASKPADIMVEAINESYVRVGREIMREEGIEPDDVTDVTLSAVFHALMACGKRFGALPREEEVCDYVRHIYNQLKEQGAHYADATH